MPAGPAQPEGPNFWWAVAACVDFCSLQVQCCVAPNHLKNAQKTKTKQRNAMQDRIGIDIGMEYRLGMQSQVSRLVVKRGPMTVSHLLVDGWVDAGSFKLHRPRAVSRSLIGLLAVPHDRAPRWAVSHPIVIHDLLLLCC